jgi:nucleotide-binding universal stress UspA family protein
MTVRDILLVLESYPKPTSKKIITLAVDLAKRLKAKITGLTFEIEFKIRTSPIVHALRLDSGFPAITAAERQKSLKNAKELARFFETTATNAKVAFEKISELTTQFDISKAVVQHARLKDLTIVSLQDGQEFARANAEELLFESGRPILLPPENLNEKSEASLERVAVAWDSSRAATRAISDAMSFLQRAKHVRFFTVLNEKVLPADRAELELKKYLMQHGVDPVIDQVDAQGKSIDKVLKDYVNANQIDLLIMGGYGHSRVKEFILGGATISILDQPFQWTLLSH